MKKSQLQQLVKEAMQGYSPQIGKTQGGTTKDFKNILTKIAKGHSQGDPVRGNKILDKANPENVARISRGEKPIYEQEANQKYTVYFKIGETDDDVDVTASSPEEAIKKVKSGEVKLAHGQDLPRTARSFSAQVRK